MSRTLLGTLLIVFAALPFAPAAAQTCEVPADRPTIQSAVGGLADCATVALAGGTYDEAVTIGRAVALTGAATSVITGRLQVQDTAVVTLTQLTVDTGGPQRAGCYPAALVVTDGAHATGNALVVRNAPGVPSGGCPLFADAFESGDFGAWTGVVSG